MIRLSPVSEDTWSFGQSLTNPAKLKAPDGVPTVWSAMKQDKKKENIIKY